MEISPDIIEVELIKALKVIERACHYFEVTERDTTENSEEGKNDSESEQQ